MDGSGIGEAFIAAFVVIGIICAIVGAAIVLVVQWLW